MGSAAPLPLVKPISPISFTLTMTYATMKPANICSLWWGRRTNDRPTGSRRVSIVAPPVGKNPKDGSVDRMSLICGSMVVRSLSVGATPGGHLWYKETLLWEKRLRVKPWECKAQQSWVTFGWLTLVCPLGFGMVGLSNGTLYSKYVDACTHGYIYPYIHICT